MTDGENIEKNNNISGAGSVWDERYANNPWPTEPNESLVELAQSLWPKKAIDFGCGTGRNSIYLASLGWDVTGVDGSIVGLEIAQQKAKENNLKLTTIHGDLTDFVPKENYYDLAVMSYIHFDKQTLKAVVTKTVSSLAAGGYLYIVGHHVSDLGKTGPPSPELLYELKDLDNVDKINVITLAEIKKDYEDGTFNTDVLLIGTKIG